jgi:hypothetical protein
LRYTVYLYAYLSATKSNHPQRLCLPVTDQIHFHAAIVVNLHQKFCREWSATYTSYVCFENSVYFFDFIRTIPNPVQAPAAVVLDELQMVSKINIKQWTLSSFT